MSLRERWISLIYRIATGSRKVRAVFAALGAVIFLSFVAGLALMSLLLDNWLGLPMVIPRPYNIVISVPILAVGIVFVTWCILSFLRARGTPVPLNPPKKLVDTGLYAVSRNPMLTGLFAILFGLGILWNSLFLMLVFTPLFVLLNVLELKHIEEPELLRRLGEPYRDYRKRVPMFIPRLWVKKRK